MKANKYRYFNNNTGATTKNEVKAFDKALEILKKEKNASIILLIQTKKQTDYIERILEAKGININVKKLFNGVQLNNGQLIKIETLNTFKNSYFEKDSYIVVTFGLRSKEIYKYDSFNSVIGIVAHQWSKDEVKNWAEITEAINIDTNKQLKNTKKPDRVVQNAFIELTQNINLVTGINNTFDEEECKTYIRALNEYKYELDSEQILFYLIAELGWEYDNAKEVIVLIDKVNSGGYFKGEKKNRVEIIHRQLEIGHILSNFCIGKYFFLYICKF